MTTASTFRNVRNRVIGAPKWSYGVITVPERRGTLLPRTLSSLANAGFTSPHLFVDGGEQMQSYKCTVRTEKVGAFGNWVLALWELYVSHPDADRFVIFQDDLVAYKNLREYLDRCRMPELSYWNLYTFPSNERLCPASHQGWYLSNQMGRGALGLVFSRQGVLTLLASHYMVSKPLDAAKGKKSIDGTVLHAMKNAGWSEYVHMPSLVQHTGEQSTIGTLPQPLAPSFRGEQFDALELL